MSAGITHLQTSLCMVLVSSAGYLHNVRDVWLDICAVACLGVAVHAVCQQRVLAPDVGSCDDQRAAHSLAAVWLLCVSEAKPNAHHSAIRANHVLLDPHCGAAVMPWPGADAGAVILHCAGISLLCSMGSACRNACRAMTSWRFQLHKEGCSIKSYSVHAGKVGGRVQASCARWASCGLHCRTLVRRWPCV